MPLFDFTCSFCGAAFEALTSSDTREAPCPSCLSACGGERLVAPSELEVEARKAGVAFGRRTRDGDDLEQYARQYGADAASTLLADVWGERFAPYQQLLALARARGVDFPPIADAVSQAFSDGFLAACGDVYDDSAKSSER